MGLACRKWLRLCVSLTGLCSVAALAAPLPESFLQPMGPVASEQATHLWRVVLITMVVIVPVLVGVPLLLWRYRYGKGKGAYRPEWDYSGKLELLLWGLPVLVVVVLASWLWHSTSKYDPYTPVGAQPLQVQAIGLDWKWVFLYPEDGRGTVNELAIPVGRPVELTLTTDTVMQSFLIAPLAGQIYAMPGMTTKLNFLASRPGLAEGENTQFNGDGFGRQKFLVRALEPADYAQWLGSANTEAVLDESSYAILRQQSAIAEARVDLGLPRSPDPVRMRLASPDLFVAVIDKYHQAPGSVKATRWGGTGKPRPQPSSQPSTRPSAPTSTSGTTP